MIRGNGYKTELYISEVYLGPCQTPMMEVFCKNISWLLAVDYFRKRLLHRSFTGSYPAGTYQLKVNIETLEQGVKYVQS